MGSVNLAAAVLQTSGAEGHEREVPNGPKQPTPRGKLGGNLNNPANHPQNRNAALSAPVITQDGSRIIGLHDPREQDSTRHGVEKEQPWHRMAAHMLNRGFTNIEVADAAGKSPEMVSILRAQRWFNELCAVLSTDKEATIRQRLNGYALEAVDAIHAIATDERLDDEGRPIVPARVKLTAHTTLLEHSQGKPTQKVLSVTAATTFSSEREEYDSIMKELEGISSLAKTKPPQ